MNCKCTIFSFTYEMIFGSISVSGISIWVNGLKRLIPINNCMRDFLKFFHFITLCNHEFYQVYTTFFSAVNKQREMSILCHKIRLMVSKKIAFLCLNTHYFLTNLKSGNTVTQISLRKHHKQKN